MKDYLVKGFAYDGTVRIFAANTTNLVQHAQEIQNTWPTATQALGRVLTASVIQGSFYKEDQSITVRIDGGGPVGKIVADADAHGHVRGYIQHPHVNLLYGSGPKEGQSNVSAAVGTNGFIQITKDLKVRDFFTSSAKLQTGEIAEDFTYFFASSEQIPAAVGLGIIVDTDNSVSAAGGFILQVMPGCKPESLDRIEEIISKMKPVNQLIKEGKTPEDIIDILADQKWEKLLTLDLTYQCSCSKEKFRDALRTLPLDDLTEMLEDGVTETHCHFCQSTYQFSKDEIQELVDSKHAK